MRIHRLTKKVGLDNSRSSSVQDIMQRTKAKGVQFVVYQPGLGDDTFVGSHGRDLGLQHAEPEH